MSQYSRAVVVTRADQAKTTAEEAMKQVGALRAEAARDRKMVESRLAAMWQLVRREYEPGVRLSRAGFLARWRWFLTGRLPAPPVVAPVIAPTITTMPTVQQHSASLSGRVIEPLPGERR